MTSASLEGCVTRLRESSAFRSKQDIARVAARIDAAPSAVRRWREIDERVLLGDDTAAIADGTGYLLFAAEGMLPEFLDNDPYFAGWSSVMVNVSDVAAMGGYPLAVVDVYFHAPASNADAVLAGIRDASRVYGAPLVGGHTTRREGGPHALAVAILGRAERLLTGSGARAGDALLVGVDLNGAYRGDWPFWNATEGRRPDELRANLAALGTLAASGHVEACKDVSNAGLAGTILMMLEASGCGGVLDLDRVPRPPNVSLERWLLTFPSYGFVFASAPERAPAVQAVLRERGIACEVVGRADASSQMRVASQGREVLLWDLTVEAFCGFRSFTGTRAERGART